MRPNPRWSELKRKIGKDARNAVNRGECGENDKTPREGHPTGSCVKLNPPDSRTGIPSLAPLHQIEHIAVIAGVSAV